MNSKKIGLAFNHIRATMIPRDIIRYLGIGILGVLVPALLRFDMITLYSNTQLVINIVRVYQYLVEHWWLFGQL